MGAHSHITRRAIDRLPGSALEAFEAIYRVNVGPVTGYFARRCSKAHSVGDLTSETFLQAMRSFRHFDPSKGTARAWLFGIARRVYADYCSGQAHSRDAAARFAGQRVLVDDDIEALVARIDAEQVAVKLMERCAVLPPLEREALELVDMCGLAPGEAATALGVSSGTLRVRLHRARRATKGGDCT